MEGFLDEELWEEELLEGFDVVPAAVPLELLDEDESGLDSSGVEDSGSDASGVEEDSGLEEFGSEDSPLSPAMVTGNLAISS